MKGPVTAARTMRTCCATHLIGHVNDQEGLYRLFSLLRDLTIELVSVNAVDQRAGATAITPIG